MNALRLCVLLALILVSEFSWGDTITDLDRWTLVQDPAHPGFTAATGPTSATLSAGNLSVPAGTDIGFQSVNGQTPASSSQGFLFQPDADFSLAIDYQWNFSNSPTGFLGLGFGIGEDSDGMNSAGVAMGTSNGAPLFGFAGAARTQDTDEPVLALGNPFLNPSTLSGTLFVAYESASGDVTVGAATTPGANSPTVFNTFAGIQNGWNDRSLMASFFIRSDDPLAVTAWSGGNADAVFSNFRVLAGNPIAIPEPSATACSISLATLLLLRRTRKRGQAPFSRS